MGAARRRGTEAMVAGRRGLPGQRSRPVSGATTMTTVEHDNGWHGRRGMEPSVRGEGAATAERREWELTEEE